MAMFVISMKIIKLIVPYYTQIIAFIIAFMLRVTAKFNGDAAIIKGCTNICHIIIAPTLLELFFGIYRGDYITYQQYDNIDGINKTTLRKRNIVGNFAKNQVQG